MILNNIPTFDEAWQPPETAASLDGPGRGNRMRPPTTGMLPLRPQPGNTGEVLLLATDNQDDQVYVARSLLYAHAHGWNVPALVCCTIHEAPLRVLSVRPTLIVIGDHTSLRWGTKQVALCRFLKQFLMDNTSVVMLYSGHRLLGRSALAAAAPDAVVSTSTDEPLLFLNLYRYFAGNAHRGEDA